MTTMTLLNCFFEGPPSHLFLKLPQEIITMILNFVKPEYVFIQKYADCEIKSLEQYDEIFKAMVVADTVCDISSEPNDLDSVGFVFRILTNQYYIITDHLRYFSFVGGEGIDVENIKIAFHVLNYDLKKCRFKIPKLKDLFLLFTYNYIQYKHTPYTHYR